MRGIEITSKYIINNCKDNISKEEIINIIFNNKLGIEKINGLKSLSATTK